MGNDDEEVQAHLRRGRAEDRTVVPRIARMLTTTCPCARAQGGLRRARGRRRARVVVGCRRWTPRRRARRVLRRRPPRGARGHVRGREVASRPTENYLPAAVQGRSYVSRKTAVSTRVRVSSSLYRSMRTQTRRHMTYYDVRPMAGLVHVIQKCQVGVLRAPAARCSRR